MRPHYSFRHFAWIRVISIAIAMVCLGLQPSYADSNERPVIKYSIFSPECGGCIRYELLIFPSGRVVFEGTVRYRQIAILGTTLERGMRETTVASEEVRSWVDLLTKANFFTLPAEYIDAKRCPSERVDQDITLLLNGKSHTVKWYWCFKEGFPSEIHRVSREIREKVNPNQWIKADNE